MDAVLSTRFVVSGAATRIARAGGGARLLLRAAPLLVLVLTAACGSARAGGAGTRAEPEARRWAELDRDARMALMSAEVLPAARRLFREHDPERYADVSCATCHGEDARERDFAMPNPELYALFPTGSPQQRSMVEEHPEMVRFMHNHLLPGIRDILGADEYDEANGTGFSCFSCHPRGGE